mmetsp:Transcript_25574/g.59624  ORF Transcript_25574/g.59624 Transcript_25574/m.59624 type:complete len:205 (+) Transcript_25574:241-855(+)
MRCSNSSDGADTPCTLARRAYTASPLLTNSVDAAEPPKQRPVGAEGVRIRSISSPSASDTSMPPAEQTYKLDCVSTAMGAGSTAASEEKKMVGREQRRVLASKSQRYTASPMLKKRVASSSVIAAPCTRERPSRTRTGASSSLTSSAHQSPLGVGPKTSSSRPPSASSNRGSTPAGAAMGEAVQSSMLTLNMRELPQLASAAAV